MQLEKRGRVEVCVRRILHCGNRVKGRKWILIFFFFESNWTIYMTLKETGFEEHHVQS